MRTCSGCDLGRFAPQKYFCTLVISSMTHTVSSMTHTALPPRRFVTWWLLPPAISFWWQGVLYICGDCSVGPTRHAHKRWGLKRK